MKKIFYLLCTAVVLCACSGKQSSDNKTVLDHKKPTITGNAYEALVVMNDQYWKAALGDTLRSYLMADIPHLPQPEPLFTLSHTTWPGFNDILKPVRNIVLVKIDQGQYSKAECRYFHDRWAEPQSIVQITAPNPNSAMAVIAENHETIVRFLTKAEMDRMVTFLRGYTNRKANDSIKHVMGLKITIPSDFLIVRAEKQHFHLCDPKGKVRRDLIIYTDYYKGQPDLSAKAIQNRNDSILKRYLQAKDDPESYGMIETRFGEDPEFTEHKDYVEMQGLWRMHGGIAMGGPFVSRSYVDEKNQRIITLLTYLYGPNEKKRNPLRQMQAVMESLTINNNQ